MLYSEGVDEAENCHMVPGKVTDLLYKNSFAVRPTKSNSENIGKVSKGELTGKTEEEALSFLYSARLYPFAMEYEWEKADKENTLFGDEIFKGKCYSIKILQKQSLESLYINLHFDEKGILIKTDTELK